MTVDNTLIKEPHFPENVPGHETAHAHDSKKDLTEAQALPEASMIQRMYKEGQISRPDEKSITAHSKKSYIYSDNMMQSFSYGIASRSARRLMVVSF